MPTTDLDVLKMIRNAWASTLRLHGGAIDVPPFLLTFDNASDLAWINYATPIVDSCDDELAAALPIIREEFAKRSRMLRFEFFNALNASLPAILEISGLKLQAQMPAMACTCVEDPIVSHRVERLSESSDESQVREFLAVREAAFGPLSSASVEDQIAELRREWSSGSTKSVLVYHEKEPAGVATLIGCRAVAELVGVGTAPAHRGHGVALAATQMLVSDHLAQEHSTAVWLTAGNDTAREIYKRIGFRFVGWQSNYIDANSKE